MTDPVAPVTPVTPFSAEPAAPVAPVVPAEPVAVQDPVPAPSIQIPEAVQGFVGEGKKYATPEDALQSIPHAQHHIERLEEEMASLREDLSKRAAVEDVLAEINKKPVDTPSEQPLTQEQLDALIDNRLATKEAQTIAQANTSEVVNKFIGIYGDKDKAVEVYTQKAADLGIPVETINNLAATSPKAVYELFGMTPEQTPPPSKISTNINSEAVVNNPVQAPVVKTVMGQSTYKDDIAAWHAAAPTK